MFGVDQELGGAEAQLLHLSPANADQASSTPSLSSSRVPEINSSWSGSSGPAAALNGPIR